MEKKLHPTLTIRLYNGEEKSFGPGTAELRSSWERLFAERFARFRKETP